MMTDGKKIMCKRKEVIRECQKNDFTTETLFKNVFEKAYSLIVFRSQYEYNDIAHVGYDLPFKDMTGLYLLLAYEKYVLNKNIEEISEERAMSYAICDTIITNFENDIAENCAHLFIDSIIKKDWLNVPLVSMNYIYPEFITARTVHALRKSHVMTLRQLLDEYDSKKIKYLRSVGSDTLLALAKLLEMIDEKDNWLVEMAKTTVNYKYVIYEKYFRQGYSIGYFDALMGRDSIFIMDEKERN